MSCDLINIGGCGFAQCEPVVCSLLLVLTQHWFSVRYSSCSVGKELISSQLLIEALSIVRQPIVSSIIS